MQVKEVMTPDPACCVPETGLQEVAKMMVDHDCGEIPVIENKESRLPIGVITDRDIVCRTVALGTNPLDMYSGRLHEQAVCNGYSGHVSGRMWPHTRREQDSTCPGC